MKILVTGANGLLGEKCTLQLNRNFEVVATDLQENLIFDGDLTYRPLDITEEERVKEVIKDEDPEIILNCGAFTDVDASEENKEKAREINVQGVQNLVNSASPLGAHIIHISTDYIFDGTNGPYKEDDEISPVNFYGQTKYESERILIGSKIPWTIIRTNVIFGYSKNREASFVNWVIQSLSRGDKIQVVNDQFGNPTWADGFAQMVEELVQERPEGIYHYGGKDYLSRFEFALSIADVFSLDNQLIQKVKTRALDQEAKRPYKAGLVSDKLLNELDIKLFGVKEALKNMKEEMEEDLEQEKEKDDDIPTEE